MLFYNALLQHFLYACSIILEPFFGQDLQDLSTEIPIGIQKMVDAIEKSSLKTKDIYFNAAPFLELLSMRNALNQGK